MNLKRIKRALSKAGQEVVIGHFSVIRSGVDNRCTILTNDDEFYHHSSPTVWSAERRQVVDLIESLGFRN